MVEKFRAVRRWYEHDAGYVLC